MGALSPGIRAAIETHGTVALSDLKAFTDRVLDDLWRAIELELDCLPAGWDVHDHERAYHERFVAERTRLSWAAPPNASASSR